MRDEYLHLTFALSAFSEDRSRHLERETLLLELADRANIWSNSFYERKAYGLLSAYYSTRNSTLSRTYAKKAEKMAQTNKNMTAEDWYDIGHGAYRSGDYKRAIVALENAVKIYEQNGDVRHLYIYGPLFEVALATRNHELIEKYSTKIEKCAEQSEDKKLKATIYITLGENAKNSANLKDALAYFKKALVLYKELDDKRMTAVAYNETGATLMISNPHYMQVSLQLFEKALEIASDLKEERIIAETLYNIGLVLAFDKNQSNMRALDHVNQSLKINKRLDDKEWILETQALIDTINSGGFDNQKGGKDND